MENIEKISNGKKNQIMSQDFPIHCWYQFVLGYPPHLVRHYISKFNFNQDSLILDPFCGTGTTPVECFKNGVPSMGIDANYMAYFATKTKLNLKMRSEDLNKNLNYIYQSTRRSYKKFGIQDHFTGLIEPSEVSKPTILNKIPILELDAEKVIPAGFISEKPLKKVLIIRDIIDTIEDQSIKDFFLLSLANIIVGKASNVGFGPEVYRKKPKDDFNALDNFVNNSSNMINDLINYSHLNTKTTIIHGDARKINKYIDKSLINKIDGVITSPPYPNEKDYTRSTRLESVLLGFISNKKELREKKDLFLRSNSRNIFVKDTDGDHIVGFDKIERIANEIEEKRIKLGKTSGFEKMYPKIVRHYFGGMFLHLQSLQPYLSPNAKLAYVVGDQMSFFKTHIPTADLLGDIATSLGYNVIDIELWRTRLATATKMQINENVLILEKP